VLASALGWVIGIGPGRGMALMFIIGGGLAALVGISGYAFKLLREADTLLPDHDQLPAVVADKTEDVDERMRRMQELLEDRRSWAVQPESPERELALRAIGNSLRKLGQLPSNPQETA